MKNITKTLTALLAFNVFALISSCKYEATTNTPLLSLIALHNLSDGKSFTVTLNENNGSSNSAVEEQIFTSKSCTLKSAKNLGFSKENHVFKGWSLSPSSTEIAHTDAETFMPETDISLYAIWQEASELKSVSQIRDIFAKLVNIEPDYSDYVYFIKAFKSADTAPASPEYFLDKNNTIPVFYDKDTSTIYYYSAGAKLKLPANSSGFFENMRYLEYIETKDFDTSGVTDMSWMFEKCKRLKDIDVTSFDTSNVTDMKSMFSNCESLKTLELLGMNTKNAKDMSNMFSGCYNIYTLDVSSFDTSNVTNMSYMFHGCSKLINLDLSNFNTVNVTDMSGLFCACRSLETLNIKKFNTQNVTTMEKMFFNCASVINLDVTHFNTGKVKNMDLMFSSCNFSQHSINLNNFDTSNVTTMEYMFAWCSSLWELDLGNFDTTNVKNMGGIFWNCENIEKLNLRSFNTAKVKYMSHMFGECECLYEIDLSSFDFSSLTYFHAMFYNCRDLHKIYTSQNADLTYINDDLFSGCEYLEGGAGTKYSENHTDSSYAKVDGGTSSPGYFSVKE